MRTLRLVIIILFTLFLTTQLNAVDQRKGYIMMSDGTKYEGELLMRTAMKFYCEPKDKTSKLMKVKLSEICKIDVIEEFSEYEETYFFPEEGKKIKEWTGKYSPRKKFSIVIYFADGQEIKGESTFQIFLMKKDEQPKRFDFRKDIHGKEGEKLEDLIHITEIYFTEPAKLAKGKISGSVKVDDKLQNVIAYGRNHQRTYNANVDSANNKYEFKGLPDDTFDLCIVCEKSIYLGSGALKPENATDEEEKELTEEEKLSLDNKIQKQIGRSEFFDRIKVLEVNGWRGSAVALVLKERVKATHLDTSDKGHKHLPRRIELWLLHMTEDDWVIDKRIYLFREVLKDNETGRVSVLEDKLKGIVISDEKKEQVVDLIEKDE